VVVVVLVASVSAALAVTPATPVLVATILRAAAKATTDLKFEFLILIPPKSL
jgi:hypothetical protein